MVKGYSVAVLAGAALLALAGATARPAHAGGATSQTFSYTGGLQTFTVPDGVTTVTIQAVGAAGGPGQFGTSGTGASMQGDFSVAPGDELTILAGEQPLAAISGGGGGGSFVWRGTDAASADNLLLAAGGGGGGACTIGGGDASTGEAGTASFGGEPGGTTGNGGSGGAAGGTDYYGGVPGGGGGGGGLLTSGDDGQTGSDGPPSNNGLGTGDGGYGGQAIALGGTGGNHYGDGPSEGGFGGGGEAGFGPSGGGGGYSGGGGGTGDANLGVESFGTTTACDGGGGGGSFNAGAHQSNVAGVNFGNGYVVVSYGGGSTDTTPPTITASATSGPSAYASGTWTNQQVRVHFDCTDADSGVASVTPDQYLSDDGADQSATGTCIDNAGNSASTTFSEIDIDRTPPSIAFTVVDPNGNPVDLGQWSSVPLTVHYTCSDATSGVASISGDTTIANSQPGHTESGECVDNAGNTSTVTTPSIQVDTQSPAAVATATVNGNPYVQNEWVHADVVVHFACFDGGGSGIATVSPDMTVSTSGLNQSASGTCTDNAGNVSVATFTGIDIDKTPPTVTYTGNAGTYNLGDQVSITCSASDALSGLASTSCANISGPAWSFGAGSHTVSATATDYAGNTGSGSTTFTVRVTFGALQTLVSRFCTKPAIALAMNVTLGAAEVAKSLHQTKVEQSLIKAFDNEVQAQSGKSLTAAQATLLIQLAAAL